VVHHKRRKAGDIKMKAFKSKMFCFRVLPKIKIKIKHLNFSQKEFDIQKIVFNVL